MVFYCLFIYGYKNSDSIDRIGIVLDYHKSLVLNKINIIYAQATCNQLHGVYYDFKLFYEAYKWLINDKTNS